MTPNATITTDATDTGLDGTEADLVATDELDDEELLVEEISIDGMCGVY